jgi:glyoxalase family protein
MSDATAGIHHITAIAGDARGNREFYTDVLGLRLVKKTVNFDDPATYHLYYGDYRGRPGTVLTFFPWTARAARGTAGARQVVSITFAVPEGSLGFWRRRLESRGVPTEGAREVFGEEVLGFRDPDGLALELAAGGPPGEDGPAVTGGTDAPPRDHAIRGFSRAGLSTRDPDGTSRLLTSVFRMRVRDESEDRIRLEAAQDGPGAAADLILLPREAQGKLGRGVVHHIAWRASSEAAQAAFRARVLAAGLGATAVIDRSYFRSVYFHEPGGILFEIATDPPGFTVDEALEDLGTSLKLPPWLEARRPFIEQTLPPLRAPAEAAPGRERTA